MTLGAVSVMGKPNRILYLILRCGEKLKRVAVGSERICRERYAASRLTKVSSRLTMSHTIDARTAATRL